MRDLGSNSANPITLDARPNSSSSSTPLLATNPITFDANSSTPLLTLALDQLSMHGSHDVDAAASFKKRVQALPEVILPPLGWRELRVEAPPFRRLLRVRIEAPLLLFAARSRQIQRVLLRFSAAWRRAHPGLVTFPTRPAVSVRRTDEFGVGDSVAIVLVTEHDTSVVEEAALRAEIGEQILANVDYTVRVERATPVM